MSQESFRSWGRWPAATHAGVAVLRSRDAPLPRLPGTMLAFGNGRSYGDSCLNDGGWLLAARGLDRFIDLDVRTGRLRCESGVLLSEILSLVVCSGWFLPVTPGTRFVTVGGALANDVHGKNHHVAGSFGHHVTRFGLLRSDGILRVCSREEHAELFAATVGGLGLTGLITWVELELKPVSNPWVRVETTRFDGLDGFFELAAESDRGHEYTVAWIDCLASGRHLGRGLYMAGDHAARGCPPGPAAGGGGLRVPFDPPVSMIGPVTLKAFNALYYRKQIPRQSVSFQHYAPFFYPLDSIAEWNRIYGPRGFLQYQSAIPMGAARDATRAMLERIARSGQGSFLSVLKVFGDRPGVGPLSFPRSGATLALDFPNRGSDTLRLLCELDTIVAEAGGALYPAKDARMPAALFAAGYPRLQEFQRHIDPAFSSSFWRRVMGAAE